MPGIDETLRTLRDVQGVYGSFVIAGTGALIAQDLPAVFDQDLFAEVGPRATRLYETFLSGGEELDACMLRYAEHKLYLRRMTWGLIGIISDVAVNMPALRMVVNLVIRRIDPEVVPSLRPTPAPPPVSLRPAPAPTPAPPRSHVPEKAPRTSEPPGPPPATVPDDARESSPPAAGGQVRMYRGRRVVE